MASRVTSEAPRGRGDLALGVVGDAWSGRAGSCRAYSFSVSARWPSSLVAFSTPRTSTPVAIGSSVPAWPTRRVPAMPRILATTSCEVKPDGLSTMTRPVGRPLPLVPFCVIVRGLSLAVSLVVLVARLPVRVGVAGVLRRPRTPRGPRSSAARALSSRSSIVWALSGRASGDEGQGRRELHPGLPADRGAQHALGALQAGGRGRPLLVVAVDRVEDGRLPQVAGDPGVRDGHVSAEPRVLDPALQRLGDHLPDEVRQLRRPRVVGHCVRSSVLLRFVVGGLSLASGHVLSRRRRGGAVVPTAAPPRAGRRPAARTGPGRR